MILFLKVKISKLIKILGKTIKWSNFKALNPRWDYTSDPLKNNYILEKNKNIWKAIGEKICKYYTDKGNTIIYTEYSDFVISKTHLILTLDESGKLI